MRISSYLLPRLIAAPLCVSIIGIETYISSARAAALQEVLARSRERQALGLSQHSENSRDRSQDEPAILAWHPETWNRPDASSRPQPPELAVPAGPDPAGLALRPFTTRATLPPAANLAVWWPVNPNSRSHAPPPVG